VRSREKQRATARDDDARPNNEMQLTGGEGGSRQWGSPFGEPVPRSRRQASPPAPDLGVVSSERRNISAMIRVTSSGRPGWSVNGQATPGV